MKTWVTHERDNVRIVWYGSMNLLSRAKVDDNLMRVKNGDAAQESEQKESRRAALDGKGSRGKALGRQSD